MSHLPFSAAIEPEGFGAGDEKIKKYPDSYRFTSEDQPKAHGQFQIAIVFTLFVQLRNLKFNYFRWLKVNYNRGHEIKGRTKSRYLSGRIDYQCVSPFSA